jgi:DNA-binding MarR family transcriptional regulator
MTTRRQLGPEAERALRAPLEGTKRRKILVLIAAYLDAGRDNPSITELAARARLRRIAVVGIVDHLEREGHLAVEREPNRRNRYSLLDRRQR